MNNMIDERMYSELKMAELHIEGARERMRSENGREQRAPSPKVRRPRFVFPSMPRLHGPRPQARAIAADR